MSELLVPVLNAVEEAFLTCRDDPGFNREYRALLAEFAGRPTPLTEMRRLGPLWGCKLVLKREDLLHGGAHKTNNVIGQAMLARQMGRRELIAETGAGQHGVATAMAGAMFDLKVKIFMGAKDIERQYPNVQRMKLYGAEIISITAGSQTLKDAINEAMRYWTAHSREAYYVFGTAAGVTSVLVADIPLEHADEILPAARRHRIAPVFMVSELTTPERFERIAAHAEGYLYVVSYLGVTGVEDAVLEDKIAAVLHAARQHTDLPLCVGFGINSRRHVAAAARAGADGVIVGSRIVRESPDLGKIAAVCDELSGCLTKRSW